MTTPAPATPTYTPPYTNPETVPPQNIRSRGRGVAAPGLTLIRDIEHSYNDLNDFLKMQSPARALVEPFNTRGLELWVGTRDNSANDYFTFRALEQMIAVNAPRIRVEGMADHGSPVTRTLGWVNGKAENRPIIKNWTWPHNVHFDTALARFVYNPWLESHSREMTGLYDLALNGSIALFACYYRVPERERFHAWSDELDILWWVVTGYISDIQSYSRKHFFLDVTISCTEEPVFFSPERYDRARQIRQVQADLVRLSGVQRLDLTQPSPAYSVPTITITENTNQMPSFDSGTQIPAWQGQDQSTVYEVWGLPDNAYFIDVNHKIIGDNITKDTYDCVMVVHHQGRVGSVPFQLVIQ